MIFLLLKIKLFYLIILIFMQITLLHILLTQKVTTGSIDAYTNKSIHAIATDEKETPKSV